MRTTVIAASVAGLLIACAGLRPPTDLKGRTEAEVVQAMGQPTGRYTLPDNGRRLEYAKGPAGRETFMVDLDAQGRVVQMEQVLDVNHFDVINPGMKEADLLRFIGRPSERSGMRGGGEILSWRYYNTGCLWWQAQLDAQRVITTAGYASLPGCDTK
ncbi:MAG TPA: hypothetical protein VLJ62_27990 [Burkholderiaceae bacterium]|nr:hypothetical protein [Burkholderiaceae bacterium]